MSNEKQSCDPCQCTKPGWCERHRMRKTPHLLGLCQTREDYRRLWDAQAAAPKPPAGRRVIERVPAESSIFSVATKAVRYTKAVARWIKAGRPVRPPSEVARIYEECCRLCEEFDPEKETCRICGCRVRKSAKALHNKIGMATEHCRMKKW